MGANLTDTVLPRPTPGRIVLDGRYCRLAPLHPDHAETLFAASSGPENRPRFDYLLEPQPASLPEVETWIGEAAASTERLWFGVIEKSGGRCEGRQALLNINPVHGTMELGGIYWGPAIARTRVATEAAFLHMQYAFDTLGYRRFEWKCNHSNEASKRAALRFGFVFEGVFRQHMFLKGCNRDTAWYSIIDKEWPSLRAAFEAWLTPENFDATGRQHNALETRRQA